MGGGEGLVQVTSGKLAGSGRGGEGALVISVSPVSINFDTIYLLGGSS
jgi:hypothetical protein